MWILKDSRGSSLDERKDERQGGVRFCDQGRPGSPTFIDAIAAKSVQDGESVSLTLDASFSTKWSRSCLTRSKRQEPGREP